jgi:hypothetical protein
MRRKFSKEEKIAAIQRLETHEPDGLNPKMVRRWRDEWLRYGVHAFSGYGKARSPKYQKTEPVIFRLTPGEYQRLIDCVQLSNARTLSEFARRQLFGTQPEPSQIEQKVVELTRAVQQLALRVAGEE